MVRVDSGVLLEKLGYDYLFFREEGCKPEHASIVFADLLPELRRLPIGGWRLYRHQLEAYEALKKGYNLVMVSGTGSGKTEAWAIYALAYGRKALAVYPTLALANDQVRRLGEYAGVVGKNVVALDASRRSELEKKLGRTGLRTLIASADIVVTNPAFLMHDVKRLLESPSKSLLEPFFRRLQLLVVDELDFYGPRNIALLDAMIEILAKYSSGGVQVVVLSATLANPEELAKRLEEVTGRRTAVVRGKPFRVENRVYLVLGKEVRRVFEEARERAKNVLDKLDPDVKRALEDFNEFRRNLYRVVAYLQALGVEVPSPGLDVVEILAGYVEDDGVTLVFTRSIAGAEQLARKLRERLGDRASTVATHHHLVSKSKREEIEEAARSGRLKIVISPRTLAQGIDIGTIVRVVHVGLPEDVREYWQREGRKGRRSNIGYTETIIIPTSMWDRELLSKGINAFIEWRNMPLEKTIVNPRNRYRMLFTGLAKLISPWYGKMGRLSDEEVDVLRQIGVLKGDRVDEKRMRWVWERLNFYEFGPPYGVKRYLEVGEDERRPLEPIGWCDLVERFQVGCIDYAEDAIVVRLEAGSRSRIVKAVVEKPLVKLKPWEVEGLEEAVEEYKFTKAKWGEEANLLKDIARAKLVSHVVALVYPPRLGFGLLRKVPNRVVWTVYSDKPRLVEVGGKHIVTFDRKTIYVPVNTAGEYRDYTYGIVVEASEEDNPTLLRIGLAYIMLVLRKVYGIAFETIMYSVEKLGDKKLVELHEPEAAGLLEQLDWLQVKRAVEEYKPTDLDTVLLMQLDEIAYSDMITLNMDWELAKRAAARIIDLLLLREKIRATLAGKTITIPKPSRANRIIAVDVVAEDVEGSSEVVPETIIGLAAFDGEHTLSAADIYVKLPLARPPRKLLEIESWIEDQVYYEGFKLAVYNKQAAIKMAHKAGLKKLVRILEEAEDTASLLEHIGLERNTPLEQLVEALNIEGLEKPRLEEPLAALAETKHHSKKFLEKLGDYLGKRVKAIYITYAILKELSKSQTSKP